MRARGIIGLILIQMNNGGVFDDDYLDDEEAYEDQGDYDSEDYESEEEDDDDRYSITITR